MILNDLERQVARGPIFPTDLHRYACTVCPVVVKSGMVTHTCRRGLILEGQPLHRAVCQLQLSFLCEIPAATVDVDDDDDDDDRTMDDGR